MHKVGHWNLVLRRQIMLRFMSGEAEAGRRDERDSSNCAGMSRFTPASLERPRALLGIPSDPSFVAFVRRTIGGRGFVLLPETLPRVRDAVTEALRVTAGARERDLGSQCSMAQLSTDLRSTRVRSHMSDMRRGYHLLVRCQVRKGSFLEAAARAAPPVAVVSMRPVGAAVRGTSERSCRGDDPDAR